PTAPTFQIVGVAPEVWICGVIAFMAWTKSRGVTAVIPYVPSAQRILSHRPACPACHVRPLFQTAAIVLRRMRQLGLCFYCGRPTFRPFDHALARYAWSYTLDHIIPACAVAKQKYGRSSPKRTNKIRRCKRV